MKTIEKTAIAVAAAQFAMLCCAPAAGQEAAAGTETATVVVTGQRAALQSAQKIKQDADEIVDSIVADDIGKLPDRSVTEVLQRVVGVTMDRAMQGDPQRFAIEGSAIAIRGLTYVRSELNGRESFSANGGRSLNFEDVPPELMAGVDVYKNPSAEQIEGGISGLVNLRTAMPFDQAGFRGAVSVQATHSRLYGGKAQPSYSLLLSNRWKTGLGEFGALVDLAHSKSNTRTDNFVIDPLYPHDEIEPGRTVWVPKAAMWRSMEYQRERKGKYAAFQWRPNRQLSTSLTYFRSDYEMTWSEAAMLMQHTTPFDIKVANGVYDAAGAFVSGILSDPKAGGINVNPDRQVYDRNSDTTDIAFNAQWRVSPAWTIEADVQRVRANTAGFASDVATGVQLPSQHLDLSGKLPVIHFTDDDRKYLANPANYYWAYTMEHLDRSHGENDALKLDAVHTFDHPVLRDVRFGVRAAERESRTQDTGYHWEGVTQPWMVGWQIPHVARLNDPRFAAPYSVNSYPNFFLGDATVPGVIFPDTSLARGFPGTYQKLHDFHQILCEEQRIAQGWGGCAPWQGKSLTDKPEDTNLVTEKTKSFYTQLRFGFDQWRFPVDGSLGVRYVKTDLKASGYTVFTPSVPSGSDGGPVTGVPIPDIPAYAAHQNYENSYSKLLPTLNLRLKASDKLQFRLALGRAMARPDFSKMQGRTTLTQNITSTTDAETGVVRVTNVDLSGTASGNPMLRPTTANQIDVTAEYYFAPGNSITLAVFNKRLKDIVVDQMSTYNLPDASGKMHAFGVTSPVNGAKGTARGFEIAYQQYFDFLPAWARGLGVQSSFTFVDSKRKLYNPVFSAWCQGSDSVSNLNMYINGCDTDARSFGNLPLTGLSRRTVNLALMFDQGPVSARLAYNWRSRSLQGLSVYGARGFDAKDTNPASSTFGATNLGWGLPLWSAGYGQLDGSFFYKLTDNLSLGIEAQNLTNTIFKQEVTQHVGQQRHAWFVTGPRYTAQMRYSF
ncbi:TonB-dependent receptor [Pseudoduganella albidiflava]|uniref:TonB-dependent receptor n=1 Tax=Pseudoduganella albidiflava TaxID=321983 RepID=A0A411X1W3_9BURK|nr:TonB-dependent receptor [Pseudoduganella albidiflava]QBI02953.1 TonB-dependent receptor [Pseudoduganella albidiflava]GGY70587.1 TonB-dependent receptor [Pseudoduganella albidiflava]